VEVVHERRGPAEPVVADQFLGQQAAGLVPKDDMPLPGHLSALFIDRHDRVPVRRSSFVVRPSTRLGATRSDVEGSSFSNV
jgi:hypothetical protein